MVTSHEKETLEQLATWMREVGATRVRLDDIELELGPAPAAPPAPVKEDKPEPAPLCRCGHPPEEHSEAGCLNGCAMETCAGSGQKPPPEEAP